jgi:hypothetical protein
MLRVIYIFLIGLICLAACKKTEPKGDTNDPRLSGSGYCNDPRAVNYNWNFPGKVDNSTCFYPSSVFKGTYLFTDSTLNAAFRLDDTVKSIQKYWITITPVNNDYNKMMVQGLHICKDTNDVVYINAGRFFKASVDSTRNPAPDTTFQPGQILGSCADTVNGFFSKANSASDTLRINLTVYNDTGVIYHIGTAIKQ